MTSCVNPLSAWWSARPNDDGHHYATFGLREGFTDRPLTLPCGKCIGCTKDKARDWSVRCYHESLMHSRNSFVTLTYADPAPPVLEKGHLQDFFKRIRSAGYKIRYFACGEYGSQTQRPHYHVLFFGEDFSQGAEKVYANHKTYLNPWLQKTWGHGHVLIGSVDPESCFYTAGYQLKNADRDDTFHLVSKRPFLGKGWLDAYHDDLVRNGFVTVAGVKHPIPSSYLARPERAFDFDGLRDRRRSYAEALPASKSGLLAKTARSREINLRSQMSGSKGTL